MGLWGLDVERRAVRWGHSCGVWELRGLSEGCVGNCWGGTGGLWAAWGRGLRGAVGCVGPWAVWGRGLCGAVGCVGPWAVWGCGLCGAVGCGAGCQSCLCPRPGMNPMCTRPATSPRTTRLSSRR